MTDGAMTREQVQKELLWERARLRQAFAEGADRSWPVLHGLQVRALLYLLNDGTCKGTTLPKSVPPKSVMLLGMGATKPTPAPGHQRIDLFTGEDVFRPGEDERFVPYEDAPDYQTVVVVADDGRSWTLVGAGICWPDWHAAQARAGIAPEPM